MRRALTLATVGSTLVAASAQEVTFSSIKAVNTPASDKDSWSFKGTLKGVAPSTDYVEFLLDNGVEMDLMRPASPTPVFLDTVVFEPEECKAIRRGTGVSCKADGARVTATKVRI